MTLAHAPFVGVEGFYGGLLHPLLVPAHAMALLALDERAAHEDRAIAVKQLKWFRRPG